jgi:alkylhydroperoxidase family enzyme
MCQTRCTRRLAGFDDKELGQLIWAAAVINTWNRLAISARSVPGTYRPNQRA